jgi:hypothetical protein
MEASQQTPEDQLAAGAAPELTTTHPGPRRAQPFRRFRSIGGRSGVDAGYVERLETELALLREENARLRFERAQRPDAGSLVERLRALSEAQPHNEDHRDAAWHLIGEALVMREVLVDVCKEIGQTTITLQTRLANLGLELPERMDLGEASIDLGEASIDRGEATAPLKPAVSPHAYTP